MKIAFDVDVLAKQMDINRMVHQVADWGYKYIEQSPHPMINPFYKHPYFQKNVKRSIVRHLVKQGWKYPLLSWCTAGPAPRRRSGSLQWQIGNG